MLPDGGMQIILSLRKDSFRIYDAEGHFKDLEAERALTGAIVTGPRAESAIINGADVTSTLGVCLRPGGAHAILGVPAHALYGDQVDLDTLWTPTAVASLRERVAAAHASGSPEAVFRVAEDTLLEQLSGEAVAHPAAILAARALDAVPHTMTIAHIAGRVGLSQRRFIQVFREAVGMTPKRYCRVRRFQAVLEQATNDPGAVDWADVALACGYVDQAHMIRDFRAFSGMTPSLYMRARRDQRNHVRLTGERP